MRETGPGLLTVALSPLKGKEGLTLCTTSGDRVSGRKVLLPAPPAGKAAGTPLAHPMRRAGPAAGLALAPTALPHAEPLDDKQVERYTAWATALGLSSSRRRALESALVPIRRPESRAVRRGPSPAGRLLGLAVVTHPAPSSGSSGSTSGSSSGSSAFSGSSSDGVGGGAGGGGGGSW